MTKICKGTTKRQQIKQDQTWLDRSARSTLDSEEEYPGEISLKRYTLGCTRRYWTVVGSTVLYWAVLVSTGLY